MQPDDLVKLNQLSKELTDYYQIRKNIQQGLENGALTQIRYPNGNIISQINDKIATISSRKYIELYLNDVNMYIIKLEERFNSIEVIHPSTD